MGPAGRPKERKGGEREKIENGPGGRRKFMLHKVLSFRPYVGGQFPPAERNLSRRAFQLWAEERHFHRAGLPSGNPAMLRDLARKPRKVAGPFPADKPARSPSR